MVPNMTIISKELSKEFEGQFDRLGENMEKYITFSIPIKKVIENGKTVTRKIKFTDSFKFMSSSLSNLVDNLTEGLSNINQKIVNRVLKMYQIKLNKQY